MVDGGTSVGAGDLRRVLDALPTATIPVWRWENQRLSVRYVAADGNVQHDVFHMPETSDREFLDAVRSVHHEVAGNLELAGMLQCATCKADKSGMARGRVRCYFDELLPVLDSGRSEEKQHT